MIPSADRPVARPGGRFRLAAVRPDGSAVRLLLLVVVALIVAACAPSGGAGGSGSPAAGAPPVDRHAELLWAYQRYLSAERGRSGHTRRAYLADVRALLDHTALVEHDDAKAIGTKRAALKVVEHPPGRADHDLRAGGKVHQCICMAGDLIRVPANKRHWFDMGPAPAFTAVRLFTNPEGWVAQFTGDGIARRFPLCAS